MQALRAATAAARQQAIWRDRLLRASLFYTDRSLSSLDVAYLPGCVRSYTSLSNNSSTVSASEISNSVQNKHAFLFSQEGPHSVRVPASVDIRALLNVRAFSTSSSATAAAAASVPSNTNFDEYYDPNVAAAAAAVDAQAAHENSSALYIMSRQDYEEFLREIKANRNRDIYAHVNLLVEMMAMAIANDNPKEALEIFDAFPKVDPLTGHCDAPDACRPDARAYRTALNACAAVGDARKALMIIDHMEMLGRLNKTTKVQELTEDQVGIPTPDVHAKEGAVGLTREQLESYGMGMGRAGLVAGSRTLRQGGLSAKSRDVVIPELNAGYIVAGKCMGNALVGGVDHGSRDAFISTHELAERLPADPSGTLFQQLGLTPEFRRSDAAASNAATAVAEGGDLDDPKELRFDERKYSWIFKDRNSLSPDALCYTLALQACRRAHDWRSAVALYTRMFQNKDGPAPNQRTHSIMFSILHEHRLPELALGLQRTLAKQGISLMPIATTAFMTVMTSSGKHNEALEAFDKLFAPKAHAARAQLKERVLAGEVIKKNPYFSAASRIMMPNLTSIVDALGFETCIPSHDECNISLPIEGRISKQVRDPESRTPSSVTETGEFAFKVALRALRGLGLWRESLILYRLMPGDRDAIALITVAQTLGKCSRIEEMAQLARNLLETQPAPLIPDGFLIEAAELLCQREGYSDLLWKLFLRVLRSPPLANQRRIDQACLSNIAQAFIMDGKIDYAVHLLATMDEVQRVDHWIELDRDVPQDWAYVREHFPRAKNTMGSGCATRAHAPRKAPSEQRSHDVKKLTPEELLQLNKPLFEIDKLLRQAALAKQRQQSAGAIGVLGQFISADKNAPAEKGEQLPKPTADLERVFHEAAERNIQYRVFQKTARDNSYSLKGNQPRVAFASRGVPIVGISKASAWSSAIFAAYAEGDLKGMLSMWEMMLETHPEAGFLLRFLVARMGQKYGRKLPIAEEHIRQYGLQKCKGMTGYAALASAAIALEDEGELYHYFARMVAHPEVTPVGSLASPIDMIWDTHQGQLTSSTFHPYSYLCHGHCSPVLAPYSLSPATLLPLYCGDVIRDTRFTPLPPHVEREALSMDTQLLEQDSSLVTRDLPDSELEKRRYEYHDRTGLNVTPYVKGNPYMLLVDLRNKPYFTVLMHVRMVLRRLYLWCHGKTLADLPTSRDSKTSELEAMRSLKRFMKYPVGFIIPKNFNPDVRYTLHGFGIRFQPFSLDPYTPYMILRFDPCDIMTWAACGNIEIDHTRSRALITAYRTIDAYEKDLETKHAEAAARGEADPTYEERNERKYEHLVAESIQHLKDKRSMVMKQLTPQEQVDELNAIELQVKEELKQRLTYKGETTKQYHVHLYDPKWEYPEEVAAAWATIHKDQNILEFHSQQMRQIQMEQRPELVREFWYNLLKPTAEDEMRAARERDLEDGRNLAALLDNEGLDFSDGDDE